MRIKTASSLGFEIGETTASPVALGNTMEGVRQKDKVDRVFGVVLMRHRRSEQSQHSQRRSLQAANAGIKQPPVNVDSNDALRNS